AKISIDISVRVSSKDDGSVLEWVSIVDLGIIQRLLGEETVRRVADKQIGLLTNCLSEALRKGV
ncbi:MAG: SRPBCC domain-containing protein, partial [Nitrososphaerota archaeon]